MTRVHMSRLISGLRETPAHTTYKEKDERSSVLFIKELNVLLFTSLATTVFGPHADRGHI